MDTATPAIVIAIAALTTFKNIADGILNWLGKRDQLRNDTKMVQLENKLSVCESQHEDSRADRERLRIEQERMNLELTELQRKLPPPKDSSQ